MNIRYFRPNRKPAIKLHTVNVIETVDGSPIGLHSFTDNPEGNKRAEERFKFLVEYHNKNGGPKFSDEDFAEFFEDGTYDDDCGYQLFLTHSV